MILKEGLNEKFVDSSQVAKIINTIFDNEPDYDKDKEHLWVIGSNSANRILYIDLCHLGTINESIVAPRDVFRLAILKGAVNVVAVHNHPSNNINPSREDELITDKLAKAGRYLGVGVLDHIIIQNTGDCYFSFADEGIL